MWFWIGVNQENIIQGTREARKSKELVRFPPYEDTVAALVCVFKKRQFFELLH